ncbi:leucyl aminopeptidase [Candidatus Woesearchaeota archaeon]|nr:leucyl aminopeptidase [Candidatus Woesearchaeota archaeon]|tara:strand:- start:54 stop:998 length:945 start_codon:yes stop_codon:yes gene_type:complete
MIKSINIILKKCLAINEHESVLIITDSKLYSIAKLFFNQAKKITNNVKLVKIRIPKVSGTEPDKKIAKEMLKHNVELLITTKSLSHTKARKNACNKGARITTMPGTNKDMIKRAIDINYNKLKKINKKLADIFDKGKKVKIITKLGTDISFNIKGRKAHGRKSGIYDKKGYFGNLPEGEVFIAPVEKTANGIFIVDASFAGIGKLKKSLKVYVENGHAVNFKGEKSKKMKNLLNSVGNQARNIAEFGIGTNEKAKITGNTLEDEKVLGTCHIALGNNFGFGGKVNIALHLDGIIKKPTILIDNKKIMKTGNLLV